MVARSRMSKASVTIASVSEWNGRGAMKNDSQVIGQVIHRWQLAIGQCSLSLAHQFLRIENEDEDARMDRRGGAGDDGDFARGPGSGRTAFARGNVGDVDGEGLERGDE